MAAEPDLPGMPAGYSDLVVEHFHHPRNVGVLPAGADIRRTHAGNRAAGVEVSFSVRISGDGVAEVRFRAFGCPHFLAAASLATERLQGLPVASLGRWTASEIGRDLKVPVEKRGRLLILEDAVRAAAQ